MAIGKPVAFEARADERLTRGFISMTTMWPSAGFTANCTLEPPVSTPTRRMHAKAASRISWYSTSERVWAGATVMESPVCTPIGSTFSIEQTITQLSAWSRMTSSSYSFQPAIDFSMRISVMGLASRPWAALTRNSSIVRGDAGAAAAEDVGGADDDGEADALGDGDGLVDGVGGGRRRGVEADLGHGLLEQLAVLGGGDGLGVGADELDAVAVEGAVLDELHGQVQRGLPAEGGQQGVGLLALDDALEDLGGERLDVGGVGEVGVGHDRRRVRVGEDDAVALLPQHPAGLGARVVELAGLADHDRAGADEQDRGDVVAARHQRALPALGEVVSMSSSKSSNR